ncbi:hypothetical protein SSOG_00535 [Streptomyces himastatinicus ATCC 53653]|uniref:Uncharacterized protein n=1 Tax=Streptomyces himastatinicus ATCC 53653 TaxID=457427 RepID=D9WB29_9ACTN|nr:hypothetical protein SSOG_00535 [Streptomyces himastatinicus ATCC 53653]
MVGGDHEGDGLIRGRPVGAGVCGDPRRAGMRRTSMVSLDTRIGSDGAAECGAPRVRGTLGSWPSARTVTHAQLG